MVGIRSIGSIGLVLGLAACAGKGATERAGATDAAAFTEPPAAIGDEATDDAASPGATGFDATAPDDAGAPSDAAADDAIDAPEDAAIDAPDPGLGLDCDPDAGDGALPRKLGCTGLYRHWPTGAIAADVQPFDPGIHLWSDGATKRRFIHLPPGTKIDTSDMNEWTFPVGTKIWKEFTLQGKKVETRYMWKRAEGDWAKTTYAWSPDQLEATELIAGQKNVWGTGYEIPDQTTCTTCHEGRRDWVLGFEAIGLSTPAATGLTMAKLVQQGWLTSAPPAPLVIPGNATESAALGWLHANCGTACHNGSDNALAGRTGLFMRLTTDKLGSVQATDTYRTAVGVPSQFQPPGESGFLRIKPRDVAHSAIPYRDSTRDANDEEIQMPPIDTHSIDVAGVQIVKDWIAGMP
jgi:hypothetical protein